MCAGRGTAFGEIALPYAAHQGRQMRMFANYAQDTSAAF
jgi:hypothetical protein